MPASFKSLKWRASFSSRVPLVPSSSSYLTGGTSAGATTTTGILDAPTLGGGTSACTATTSGSLDAPFLSSGTSASSTITTGILNAPELSGGTSIGTTTTTGALDAAIDSDFDPDDFDPDDFETGGVSALSGGIAASVTTTSGSLDAPALNGGTSASSSTTSGALSAPALSAGTATSTATTAGALTAPALTGGTAEGTTTTSGSLDAPAVSAGWTNAVAYPDTDGVNAIGSNTRIHVQYITLPAGTVSKLRVGIATKAFNKDAKIGLYDSSRNFVGALNAAATINATGEFEFSLASPSAISAGDYIIAAMVNGNSSDVEFAVLTGQPSGTSQIIFSQTFTSFPYSTLAAGTNQTVKYAFGAFIS